MSSSDPRGTVGWYRRLKRPATVRRATPSTQAAKGPSARNESSDEKTLMKTSWTVSSVSARLPTRLWTNPKTRGK